MPLDQPDDHEDYDAPEDPDYGYGWNAKHAPNDSTMPLGAHIEELRGRLVKMLIGVAAALIGTVIFSFQIIGWLAQPLLHAQEIAGVPSPPIQTDPTAGFTSVYMPVVLIAAVIVASPWIIWQAWLFVVVGLYEHEKRAVHILAPFSIVMTALGVGFTYYILLPISLLFFLNFVNFYPEVELTSDPPWVTEMASKAYVNQDAPERSDTFYAKEPAAIPVFESRPNELVEGTWWINDTRGRIEMYWDGQVSVISQRSTKLITPMPTMSQYVKFAAMMMLGIVVAFQLPVVMLVLGWTQLFDPRGVGSLRKYALFAACALGAILTPSDPISMLVLAVPLYLLFEFGLLLMKFTYKKTGDEQIPQDL